MHGAVFVAAVSKGARDSQRADRIQPVSVLHALAFGSRHVRGHAGAFKRNLADNLGRMHFTDHYLSGIILD